MQAKGILSSVRPRDVVGKTRKMLASEQLAEMVALDQKIKASTKELKTLVLAQDSTLMDLTGVGPVEARRRPGRSRPGPPPTSHRPANASTRRTASGCSDAAAIDAASCRTCARSASTSAPRASAFVGP